MVYAYVRISTNYQILDNQKFEIETYAKNHGMTVDKFVMETVSGTKEPKKRKLGPLLRRMKEGDTLLCSEISRLGRTLFMIMEVLNYCMKKGIHIYTVKEGYTLGDNIQSKVLAFAFGIAAEIERTLISERTKEALKLRRAQGVKLGHPVGEQGMNRRLDLQRKTIQRWRREGKSIYYMCKRLKCHTNTLKRYFRMLDWEADQRDLEKRREAGKLLYPAVIYDIKF